MDERIFQTANGAIHYWYSDTDASETLVFLHGLTADHRLFDAQIPYFSKTYNCLVWDAPAHGASRPYAGFSYPDCAEVLRSILDLHRIETPILIGQSMGGYVIQSFLLRYPQRAKAFISIDSCPYGEAYYSRSDRWWLRQIEWMAKCYPVNALKHAVAKQCTTGKRSEDNMRSMLEPYSKQELCHLMGIGFAGFLEDNRDMAIPCPVLLIVGEKDVTGKVRAYNNAWAAATGYPLCRIPNAAHNANDDQPEIVNRSIEDFIGTLRSGSEPQQTKTLEA